LRIANARFEIVRALCCDCDALAQAIAGMQDAEAVGSAEYNAVHACDLLRFVIYIAVSQDAMCVAFDSARFWSASQIFTTASRDCCAYKAASAVSFCESLRLAFALGK